MNIILIARTEIICLVILLFLFIFTIRCWESEEKGHFLKMCIFALGHVIFDLITVGTVNYVDQIPLWLNNILHFLLYEFAILFCYEFFCYVCNNIFPYTVSKKAADCARILPIIYPLVMPFFQIEFLQGNGTKYSYGTSVLLGYLLAALLFIVSFLLVLLNRKMDRTVRNVLLPILSLMLTAIIIQCFIPELLFTGADVTLAVMGMYFAVENPVKKYRQRAYFDMGTGVRNRNCYEDDISQLDMRCQIGSKKTKVACVICDLNGLKAANDCYGHVAGDELIRLAAKMITNHLHSAYRIYRIGGDEFAAIYIDEGKKTVEAEIANLKNSCRNAKTESGLPLSMAIGYAQTGENDSLTEMIDKADKEMYRNKVEMKNKKMF